MTSRPKLLVRSCPVVVAHSLPAGFDSVRAGVLFTPLFTRSRSDHRSAASCGRPLWLCTGSFESVLFARARVPSVLV